MQLDVRGPLRVTVPVDAGGILKLGRVYLDKEKTLPEEERIHEPRLSVIESLVIKMEEGSKGRQTGEVTRAQSAESLAKARQEALPLAKTALKALEVRYAGNLSAVEAWGFSTVATSSGVAVRRPSTQAKWREALNAYYEKERTQPLEQRLTTPAFADVERVCQTMASSTSERDSGRTTRRQGVLDRDTPAARLQDLLQIACAVLLSRTDGQVTTALEGWGFKTAAAKSAPPATPSEGAAAPTPAGE